MDAADKYKPTAIKRENNLSSRQNKHVHYGHLLAEPENLSVARFSELCPVMASLDYFTNLFSRKS